MDTNARQLILASLAGLVVNLVSSALGTSSVAILISAVAVIIVVASHRRRNNSAANDRGKAKLMIDGAIFYLASFAVGVAVAGISLLPILPDRIFQIRLSLGLDSLRQLTPFHGYELLAVSAIVVLAVLAAFRGQGLYRVLTFTVSAVGGASFIISAVFPQNDFVLTFLGWAVAAAVIVGVLMLTPSLMRALAAFWRIGELGRSGPSVAEKPDGAAVDAETSEGSAENSTTLPEVGPRKAATR